jgi:hypothetical protein
MAAATISPPNQAVPPKTRSLMAPVNQGAAPKSVGFADGTPGAARAMAA